MCLRYGCLHAASSYGWQCSLLMHAVSSGQGLAGFAGPGRYGNQIMLNEWQGFA